MMFFAYNRGAVEMGEYFVRPFPFQSIRYLFSDQVTHYETFKNIVGNIILFMPYGFLGILYPKLKQYKYLLPTFFLAINYLEFTQYFFKRGYAELDDVIMNCFGMTLGFVFYKFLNWK